MDEKIKFKLLPDSRNDLLKQVINSMPDPVFFKDLEGRYLGCNQEYEKLIGRQEAELVGKTAQEIYGGMMPDSYADSDITVIKTLKMVQFETWLMKADGKKALIEASKSPLYDSDSEMIGILVVLRDITKQREAEEALKASEEKFRFITENTSDVLWTLDIKTHKFTYLSPAAQDLWGYPLDELMQLTMEDLMPPEFLQIVVKQIEETLPQFLQDPQAPRMHYNRIQQICKDGSVVWIEFVASYRFNDRQEITAVGVSRNIDDRIKAEQALKLSEEKYRMIAENTTDTIWLYNMDQERFTYISPAILQLRGYTVEEALSQTLLDTVAPGSLEGVAKGVADARDYLLAHPDEPISHTVEIQQTTKSGDPVWVEVSVKLQFNDQGEATVLGVSRNIEDRKRAESEILYLGYHDQLTGLYNRHYFETIINGEMDRADRYKEPLSMLLLDLDHFKAVNDTWGHLVGDDLLKTMSAAIQKEIRSTDTLVRYGGEELIILMPHTTKAGALLVADKIQAAIKINPHHTAGIQTVSIGVAQRMQSESFRHLYIRLDHALYQAKENGRDCVVASDERIQIPSDQMRIEWRSVWESGNTIIDTQHKELLQIANNLLDLTSNAYICQDEEEKIDLLLKHIEKHFEAEEKILEQIGFPNYENHVAVHQSLLLRVSGLNRNCGNGEINTAAFYSFVVDDVVLGHLLEDDIKFFPYL